MINSTVLVTIATGIMKILNQRLYRSVGGMLPVRYSTDNRTAAMTLKYFNGCVTADGN